MIAVSDTVREQTHRYLGVSSAKTRTIQHGIDPEPFACITSAQTNQLRTEWGAGKDTVVIGTVGRLVPQKALHILLEAFAHYRVVAKRPSRLIVVGCGPLEAELKARSLELGIADAVVWPGFREDIPAIISSFDVFALSSHYEGFGIVLLEAMAAGKPVAVTNVSAIPEIVQDGVTGLLSRGGDSCAFSAALLQLEDKALRERLGMAGRKRVHEFTLGRMIDATLAAYAEAINGAR